MNILVPGAVTDRLHRELRAAGRREIGGVLVGEHVEGDQFRLADLSVQHRHGDSHRFVRDPEEHRAFLAAFFDRTGHDYTRYNYLGEWHSHPNVVALPSTQDVSSMREIVADPAVGAAFAVLLIARSRPWRGLELSASVFVPHEAPKIASLSPDPLSARGRAFREVQARPRRRLIRI